MIAGSQPVPVRLCELVVDPAFDVAPSEAEMSADPETGWSSPAIAPRVDGGYRHLEIVGQVFNGEQPIDVFHDPILRFDPCRRVDQELTSMFVSLSTRH